MKLLKTVSKITAILFVCCMLLFLCSCAAKESKFVGNWVCEEVHSGYPDQMTMKSDGTGMADGYSMNWSAEDGIVTFNIGNAWIGSQTYEYSFIGSVLYLDDYAYTKN